MEEADGTERDAGGGRLPLRMSIPCARSRCHILLGEASLRHALSNYVSHFHTERNHQGKDNVILFPAPADRIGESTGEIQTRERLGDAC